MHQKRFSLVAAALLAAPTFAAPPKLLVVISVDQLSGDLFDEYRGQFTGGLARIASGTVFRNGYQSHAATETCPGHATILSGVRPARSGIVGNDWIDQSVERKDKTIYCVEDERAPGSTSSKYVVFPMHLKVPTLGELMRLRWPESRTVAVAGKDRSAVAMSGHRPAQRWYLEKGAFVSDLAGPAPASVGRTNAALQALIASARAPLEPPPFCQARSADVPVEGRDSPVGGGRLARAAGDKDVFERSPERDGAVLALGAALVQEMKLGKGSAPDLLAIGLSATDAIGHRYGPGGQEMCLQLLSLDRDLAGFFAVLDSSRIDYAVALTADHGVQEIPERLRRKGIAAARVDANLSAAKIGEAIAARLGLAGRLLHGGYHGDIYLDRALGLADRARVLREALAAYRAHPQVEAAFSADEIMKTAMPASPPDRWTMIERARASYHPGRSGDLFVVLRRYVTPIRDTKGSIATHGSPWDYDRRVPILFWGAGMAPSDREQAIETVDIMPTLAALLALEVTPGTVDGKCLPGIPGASCPIR